jgi:type 1 fimbria pilin
MMFAALLLAALSPAMADEAAAESCLKTKIWEGYNSGWAVRTATNATLGQGEHRVYLVTLYAGTEYKIMVCGDNVLTNADIVLYDSLGNELMKDTQDDREPVLTYKASATDTFYIAVHATRTADPAAKAGVATAVTYK